MEKSELGIGFVGYKVMGQVHSNAYRQVARYFDVDPEPVMRAICGRNEDAVRRGADTLGWQGHETDYQGTLHQVNSHGPMGPVADSTALTLFLHSEGPL